MKKHICLLILSVMLFSISVHAESADVEKEQNIAELLDYDALVDEAVDKLVSIGVTEANNTIVESLEENSGIVNVTILCETVVGGVEKVLEVEMFCSTVTSEPKWYVNWIKKHINEEGAANVYYYVPDELTAKVNLYDYTTDELISSATEELNVDETVEEFNEVLDNTQIDFENVTQEADAEVGEEILFRDVPWGISYSEALELLPDFGFWALTGEGYMTFSVDEVILGDGQGLDFEYTDINIIAHASEDEIQVAGYTTSDITMYFAYLPVNGVLTKAEEDSYLYAARYEFEPQNLKEMEKDLIQKLSSLYGEPNETGADEGWNGVQYNYTYWNGANNTMVVLKSADTSAVEDDSYKDELYISYACRKGDELLQNASDAIASELINDEASVYGNGDASGL